MGEETEADAEAETRRLAQGMAESETQRDAEGDAERRGGRRREREREQKREKRRERRERECVCVCAHTRAMRAKCWSSCCARANIRVRATVTVASHVESDIHEHANGCRKRRIERLQRRSLEQLARLHKTRACENTGYIPHL